MSSFNGGTVGGNILPDTTGRDVGSTVQPWDGFFQDATISRTLSVPSGATATVASQNTIRDAASFNWTQHPAGISAGAATVTLTPVPAGVNGTDANHYIYLSVVGTPEAVLITGGTAVAGAASGTITFTAANAHSTGFSIGSATGGIQEAIIDAGTSGSVVISGAVSGSLPAAFSNANNIAILDLRGGVVTIHGGLSATGNLTGNLTGNVNGSVGAISPAAGAFTTLSASGQASLLSVLLNNPSGTADKRKYWIVLGADYFVLQALDDAGVYIRDLLYASHDGVFRPATLASYANNAAAVAGGLPVRALYRTGADPDVVCVVH